VLGLLFVAAMHEQRRADHRDAHAHERRRHAQPRDLLAEHLGVATGEPSAAVFLGPRRHGEPAHRHRIEPALAVGDDLLGLLFFESHRTAAQRLGCRLLEEGAELGAEGIELGGGGGGDGFGHEGRCKLGD
jgi:hypothetical protein